jgi:hypothetical protein
MARREIITITDDLDGSETDVRTVALSFEGRSYSVDLAPHNYTRLSQALEPFIAAARPAALIARSRTASQPARPTAEVRGWLRAHGWSAEITDRGRIPQRLLEAYQQRKPKQG